MGADEEDDSPLVRSISERQPRIFSALALCYKRSAPGNALDDEFVLPSGEGRLKQRRSNSSPSIVGSALAGTPVIPVLRSLLSEVNRRSTASTSEMLTFKELPFFAHAIEPGDESGRAPLLRSQLRTKLHQHFRERWPTTLADWTEEELRRDKDRGVANRSFGQYGLDLRAIAVPYINAARIPALHPSPLSYVATEHPTGSSVGDFWRMVLLLQPCAIVMLNAAEAVRDIEAFPEYWRTTGSRVEHEPYVELSAEHMTAVADCAVRSLRCSLHGLEWRGPQLVASWWHDQSEPPLRKFLSLLRLLSRFVNARGPAPTPVLVHCAGGIGRAGVLIAADLGARAAVSGADPALCSPDRLVGHLRRSRANMVQTAEQYEFLHLALPPLTAQLQACMPVNDWLDGDACCRRTKSMS